MKKVLVSTIQPVSGGVPTMLSFVLQCLAERNCEITIAYYEPYSVSPDCSVPFFKLPRLKSPLNKTGSEFQGNDCIGLGCWFPELEFTHYWATSRWKTLIEQHDVHLTVSGSAMAALPYVQTKTNFLAWVATDWSGDRTHRVKEFTWVRRLLDRIAVSPIAKRLEKSIVRSGSLIALSGHTQSELNKISGSQIVNHVMPMPIDTKLFRPCVDTSRLDVFKVGFVGRFEDPRKNIMLLINSMARLVENKVPLEVILVGDELSPENRQRVKNLGLEEHLSVVPYVDRGKLPEILSSWQAFVIPSHQEGLCITALEAMSCGVPIVSTKCGEPESYIIDKENGLLVEHTADDLSQAINSLYLDVTLRERIANAARSTIEKDFSTMAVSTQFLSLYDELASADKLRL